MSYRMKPLGCDPQHVKGMSEKLIVSHYENNYGGAVKRLNLITEQLAGPRFQHGAHFLINGLKREELIASNSMILHELFFDGLGEESAPGKDSRRGYSRATSARSSAGAPSSSPWARRSAAAPGWVSAVVVAARQAAGQPMGGRPLPHARGRSAHRGQPILALDMYEHSYHIDYGAKAATYVDTYHERDLAGTTLTL